MAPIVHVLLEASFTSMGADGKAQQKAGGGGGKKRGMNLATLIDAGYVKDGAVLRYMKVPLLPLFSFSFVKSLAMLTSSNSLLNNPERASQSSSSAEDSTQNGALIPSVLGCLACIATSFYPHADGFCQAGA